jgi:uncharacterized membrane protein YphA (DoxX/SURF4 family)
MGAAPGVGQAKQESGIPHWNIYTRVAFRFCFAYFGPFCLTTQIFGGFLPIFDIPDPDTLWPMRQVTLWTAAHVFGVKTQLVYTDSGSGDKTFDWVVAFCLLVFAMLATVIWSILDRKRENYVTLHKWFRLFIRFALASQMLVYGLSKAIPLQMPFPGPTILLEPSGNLSPMGILWLFIGASPAYEIFTGCAETLGGILLIFPRTTMFGALVCLADTVQVFVLNMTYDVPVKLFSFHLILMVLFLLAPELRRLASFFFLNRPAGPSTQPQLFRSRRANQLAFALQIIFGIFLVGTNVYNGWSGWHTYGGGVPKSALYGVWEVKQLSVDGQLRSPLLNDYDRWRRVIFDYPNFITFQRMDDSFAFYGAAINANDKTIALTRSDDKNWKGTLTFQRVAQDQLTLDGDMDSHKIRMELELIDRTKFLLVSRGFHWIQEYPFNR